jgi:poly(3-hydroxyoctanoate) depolymerase
MHDTLSSELMTVAGQRILVGQYGSPIAGQLPLLVFNGMACALESMQPFVTALPPRHIISFDMPGIGGSPAPMLPYRFSSMARLAVQLLDVLHFTCVDVLGFSWGGALAQQFAYDYSGRCRRLILASTTMGAAANLIDPSAVLTVLSDAAELGSGSPEGNACQLAATTGWTSANWLHKLDQPTLVLSAEGDTFVPMDHATMLVENIPDACLHIIKGGHMALLRDAGEAASAVENFLSEPKTS